MSYLVLARRFRPQTFASIVGQEHISRALVNAIIRDRIAHALLFTGPRGVGKTTTARVLSRALNCTGRDLKEIQRLSIDDARALVEPCGECQNCIEIARGSSLACLEIDGASNNSVENVRELVESLRILPPPGSIYRIFLIDEVHMLSTSAFNALLKSLEEPPSNTVFIFATTDPQKIPETVISRCQQFDFRKLPLATIVANLRTIVEGEEVEIEEAVFTLVAEKAQGGMRDAQSLLDRLLAFGEERITLSFAYDVFGLAPAETIRELVRAIVEAQPDKALQTLQAIFSRSLDLRSFISDWISWFRCLMLISSGHTPGVGEGVSSKDLSYLQELRAKVERFDSNLLFQTAVEVGDRALISNYPKAVLEGGIVRMASLGSLRPLAQIVSDLSKSRIEGSAGRGSNTEGLSVSKKSENLSKSNPVKKEVQLGQLHTEPAQDELKFNRPIHDEPVPTRSAQLFSTDFNPSWTDFVLHVKNAGAPIIAQFLKRVTPSKFTAGKLILEGNEFDISALSEKPAHESLLKVLREYAPDLNWSIQFVESRSSNAMPAIQSIAAREEDAKRKKVAQLEKEAMEDPIVKAALSTFEGSSVVGVVPLRTVSKGKSDSASEL